MAAAIELQSVVKAFGPKRAVDGVTFSVEEGAIYGLIGPNGAGKTTTFSMLAGYLAPSEGTARVLGHAPTDVAALKGKLGVLPQDALLPPIEPVGSFLVYLAKMQGIRGAAAEAQARSALARVGGSEWWDVRCGKLSHGMAKRVGIAQSLLGSPKVVLLDEPTAGLDPRVAYDVRQLIKSLGGECTVVVSSHNLQELEEVCSGAAILDHGKLVAKGSIAELTASTREFTVEVAPMPSGTPRTGPSYDSLVKGVPGVTTVNYDEGRGTLLVGMDPAHDGDIIVGMTLRALLDQGARIRSLSRGRSLEQRVMELT